MTLGWGHWHSHSTHTHAAHPPLLHYTEPTSGGKGNNILCKIMLDSENLIKEQSAEGPYVYSSLALGTYATLSLL
jgi:hypothetical protein